MIAGDAGDSLLVSLQSAVALVVSAVHERLRLAHASSVFARFRTVQACALTAPIATHFSLFRRISCKHVSGHSRAGGAKIGHGNPEDRLFW